MRLYQKFKEVLDVFEKAFKPFKGGELLKLAVILNVIDRKCGGLFVSGVSGVGKSLFLLKVKEVLSALNLEWVEVPLGATEENLLGTIDIEATIREGKRVSSPGLLEKAAGKFLIIDDFHLFSETTQAYIFSKIENYTLVATINPEEARVSPHFLDKVGFFVPLSRLKEEELTSMLKDSLTHFSAEVKDLVSLVKKARHYLTKVGVTEAGFEKVVDICRKSGVTSHRGEEFLFFAARAVSALLEIPTITKDAIELVAPLVLAHRAKNRTYTPEEKQKQEKREEKKSKKSNPEPKKAREDKEKDDKSKSSSSEASKPEENALDSKEQEKLQPLGKPAKSKEDVFDVGNLFKPRTIVFRKDRLVRNTGGRRTKSKSTVSGRFVKTVEDPKFRQVDVLGTLKAAAPFQRIRKRGKTGVVITKDDLRFKEKEKKIGHLVVFLVDGSGSMAARQRMFATKGAILSLLMECYQKREKVSMILFRKFSAEVVLPPTNSVSLAYKKLKDLPTGGNTPLPAGLFEAYKLIKKYHLKFPLDRIILILLTDGRANIPIVPKEDPLKEAKRLCLEIAELPYLDTVVVDTEAKDDFIRFDMAKDLASWLGAQYFTIENLSSDSLISIVKNNLLA